MSGGRKSMRGIWEEESFHLSSPEEPAGHLELAWETSLKVTMVKIELVWEGVENSCSCLGLGAREADGQARAGTGNLGLGACEYTPRLPDSRAQSQEGREEYGTLNWSESRGPYTQHPDSFKAGVRTHVCMCIDGRGGEI